MKTEFRGASKKMTHEQKQQWLASRPPDFRKRNPHLFVGGLETKVAESVALPALESRPQKRSKSKGGVAVCVTFITKRRRLLDDDNNVGSLKPLRDAVAEYIGIDDGDSRIAFEYHQIKTTGKEGVVVKIEA